MQKNHSQDMLSLDELEGNKTSSGEQGRVVQDVQWLCAEYCW